MATIDVEVWRGEYYTQLLPHIREEDKNELSLLGKLYGYSWQQMLARSILTSNYIKAFKVAGVCHGVLGVRSYTSEEYATVWFICTPIFSRYAKSFCKVARSSIQEIAIHYPVLINCVSQASLPLVAPFLSYCGFIISKHALYIGEEAWYPFIYRRVC